MEVADRSVLERAIAEALEAKKLRGHRGARARSGFLEAKNGHGNGHGDGHSDGNGNGGATAPATAAEIAEQIAEIRQRKEEVRREREAREQEREGDGAGDKGHGGRGRGMMEDLAESKLGVVEADLRLKLAKAEQAELNLAERRKELLDARQVQDEQVRVAREIRNHMMSLASRRAAEVAGELGVGEVEVLRVLDRVVREHLMEKVREMQGASGVGGGAASVV